jgi:outer membrane autotransporter protein
LVVFKGKGAIMKSGLLKIAQLKSLESFPRAQGLLILILLVVALASPAHSQTFDQAVTNACAIVGTCAGAPAASGGSTTALTNESTPVPERKFEKLMGPWNLYVAADYEYFHKQVTTFEPGYNNNIWRGAVGADYSLNNVMLLGGALRYMHDDGDFRGGGNFDTNSYGFLVHANYIPAPQFFLDTSAGYMRKNYDIARLASLLVGGIPTPVGTTKGDPDGNEATVGVNGGYDFNFQNVTMGPRLGLNYKYTNIDGYRERGTTNQELVYDDQNENSLTSSLGVYGSVAISTGFGVLIPQAAAEYVHEFMDNQRRIGFRLANDPAGNHFSFKNDPPDRNYFNLGAGVLLQLARGIAPFINYRALVGYSDQSSHRVTAGVRVEF